MQTLPRKNPAGATTVHGLKFPFLYPIAAAWNSSDAPPRIMRPDVSAIIQDLLEKMRGRKRQGIVVDVGAGDGIVSFSAAVMGFPVVAFEPVMDNVMKICDGIRVNRFRKLVRVFQAVVSDGSKNLTNHKMIRRVDKISNSTTRSKMNMNEVTASIALDEIIGASDPVLILKIDVQGSEYRVLKGATKLLSRKKGAPYLIYAHESQASNSTSNQIHNFLTTLGYKRCTQHGPDQHCTKTQKM